MLITLPKYWSRILKYFLFDIYVSLFWLEKKASYFLQSGRNHGRIVNLLIFRFSHAEAVIYFFINRSHAQLSTCWMLFGWLLGHMLKHRGSEQRRKVVSIVNLSQKLIIRNVVVPLFCSQNKPIYHINTAI